MQNISPRITPLHPQEFSAEQRELVGPWTVLNFSRVLAHHPALYRAFVPFIEKVISYTELPPRDREILVLRVLTQCSEIYEMCHHLDIAHKVGMTDAEIAAIKLGGNGLAEFERCLIKAADELLQQYCLSEPTWQALAQRYSTIQLMEVIGLVGCYTTMAMLTRSLGIQPESKEESAMRIAELRNYT